MTYLRIEITNTGNFSHFWGPNKLVATGSRIELFVKYTALIREGSFFNKGGALLGLTRGGVENSGSLMVGGSKRF